MVIQMDNVFFWLSIIFAAIIIIAIAYAVIKIKRKMRSFSNSVFGTDTITEGLERQKELLAEKPKSVSSMTKLFLPQITEDFPELNYPQLKTRAENALLSAFISIDNGKISNITGSTDDFINQIRLQIEDNKASEIEEHFSDAQIYDTQISDYRKGGGMCKIILQSSVGHIHYKSKGGKTVWGDDSFRTQTKYNTEIVYIQNPDLIKKTAGNAVGTVCPNCGAPITSVGKKKCQYCGLAVETINIKTWLINSFKEV